MRVAALYDIHGNVPALDAVLREVEQAGVDRVVVGGDVVPGPMPRDALERLLELDRPVDFIQGNGELAVLAQMSAATPDAVTYWGTVSGAAPPEPVREVLRWTAGELRPDHEVVLARWPKTLALRIGALGEVLFCHGTPRSEVEVFTRATPVERLAPLFEGLAARCVVCGHTHMQFDRQVGRTRVVNAGSVGMPYGGPGAYWALLGDDVELKRTDYDLDRAARRIRATSYPQAEEFATRNVLRPPAEEDMLRALGSMELK